MRTLQLDTADVHKFGDRTYYVFPAPATHTNGVNRPIKYADQGKLKTYLGRGNNRSAQLLPEVHSAVNEIMTALLDYGDEIGDHSIQTAVVQNGWREPDEPSQGVHYYENIQMVMKFSKFAKLKFPESLEAEAEGMLGEGNDPRWQAFIKHLAESPGWDMATAQDFLTTVGGYYVQRGAFNPHATGLVFDLNFWIYHHILGKDQKTLVETEDPVNARPGLNEAALRSALGMWLNTYSKEFNFDSYNTGKEIWHMEWRNPKTK